MSRFKNIRSNGMIKTIIRAIYSAFISIVLISIVLAGWTSYAFLFQSSKSSEIMNVIKDMYASQKSVVFDVIDLSRILIKDRGESIPNKNNDLLSESELRPDLEDNSPLDEASITDDNVENPLGIIIKPSLHEVLSENESPETTDEPLINE